MIAAYSLSDTTDLLRYIINAFSYTVHVVAHTITKQCKCVYNPSEWYILMSEFDPLIAFLNSRSAAQIKLFNSQSSLRSGKPEVSCSTCVTSVSALPTIQKLYGNLDH